MLDAWERRRAERDLLIKMNTGTGKTAGLTEPGQPVNADEEVR